MTPRIVSWSDNEICISPVLSSTASIVSFDSAFSDTYPSHSQTSPIVSGAPGVPSAVFSEGKIPRSGQAIPDDSFIRHDAYFFKDGNATFLVDGTLYCVHRYFFTRDSVYFSKRFAQLHIRDHEALSTIISIGDVERKDFEALLSVLYPANFEAHELTYEQWESVLHLSTRWGFASLRKLALKSIKPPTSHDQFVLARTYSVDHWVLPALTALCGRSLPLSLDEARQMSMEDVILVATVREEIRGGALRVDPADIRRHVEVAQAGKLDRLMCNDVYLDRPKSGNAGQDSDSTKTPRINPNVKAEIAKTIRVASRSSPQKWTMKESDTDESDVEHSVSLLQVFLEMHANHGRKIVQSKEKACAEAKKAAAEVKKAEAMAKREATAKAEAESQQAKLETEAQAKADAEAKAKVEAKAKEAKSRAKAEAEAKAKREAASEAKAKYEAEAKAKYEAEKCKAEAKAKHEAEREAEAKAKYKAEAKAKYEAEEREAEAKALYEARAKRNAEEEAKAKYEAEKREAEAKALYEARAKRRAEEEAKAKYEAEKREAEAEALYEARAKRKAEEEAKAKYEAEKREAETRALYEARAKREAENMLGRTARGVRPIDW
ncbi:hypothetical protein EDB86DRAFT_3094467 [Lactarius hatsudake]|nr:hypothetical protein EDB86DRAFT_3094467 [Lactarius hatsudake]